ncbi:pentatricopeptide repeat-containing protein At5g39350-like isoform X2 [Tasmannia lanceolata]
MYAKVGHIQTSRRVFDGISQRDLISWNALLSGYSLNGLDKEALEVFREILVMGLKPNVSTFVSIIPVCTHLGGPMVGKSIHGFAVKCGVYLEESVVPALISMYAGCEDLSAAQILFGLLPARNVIAWNAMISACTQNRKFNEAFDVFRLMCQEDMTPNLVTLVSILPSCGNLVNIQYGESVHAYGMKIGLMQQVSIATCLMSVYAKLGDIDAARFLFDGMSKKNILSWNSIISSYIHNGLSDMGLVALHEMQLSGIIPDSVTMVSILSACAQLGDLPSGKSAHAYCLRNGFSLNLNVLNALLALYSDCGQFSSSLELFHNIPIRNVISWNTLISGCVRNGDKGTAIACLRQMQQEDVRFDLVTVISILPIFCLAEDLVEGTTIHGHASKTGYGSDVSLVNALISMYVNCGDLEAGQLLFDCMPFRSVVSWNALITGYRNHNLFREVMVLFDQMKFEDQKPNSVTLLNLLSICKSELQGKSIHAYAVRTCILESPLVTSLICMYDKFENINSCCKLFELADKRNVVVWNAMMSMYVKSKRAERTLIYFHEMLWMETEPNSVTILALVSACVQLGSIELAECITAYIICKGFDKDIFVSNALIDMYARCGNILVAKKIFDSMNKKDAVSWSVLINGYGMHGDGDAALALFSEMKCRGVRPDEITFIGILSACSHSGLVDIGQMLFNSMMEEYHIIPRMEHYACMVDLFARTGHLDEAYDFIKRLPFKPSANILESLLGACSVHGNTELGEEIGRLLNELEPENSGSYVMLANIYSAAGRWIDASILRSDMEGRGLRKVPGFSLTELNRNAVRGRD